MCLSPNSIPNPYYGLKPAVGSFASLKDCTSRYIRVPCGYCSECIKAKQLYLIQRVQMECIGKYVFYATLTYNKEHLPAVTTSSGYELKYADWHHLQNCFKRLRKSFSRPFKYLAVSERGTKRGRPHFHVLFFVPRLDDPTDSGYIPYSLESELWKKLLANWSVNVGSRKFPKYEPLCTFQRKIIHGRVFQNYDLHYVRPAVGSDSNSSVAFYVTKYLLKPSDKDRRLQQALRLNLDSFEYEDTWKLVKSRVIASKGLGLNLDSSGNISPDVISYLHGCISKSEDFPKFYSPVDGRGFPLSKYYKSKGDIYTLDDAMRFYMESDSATIDSVPDYGDPLDRSQLLNSLKTNEKKSEIAFNRGSFDFVSELFD